MLIEPLQGAAYSWSPLHFSCFQGSMTWLNAIKTAKVDVEVNHMKM